MQAPILCAKCGGVIPAGWPCVTYMVEGIWIFMHRFVTECDEHKADCSISDDDVISMHGMGVSPR